MEENNAPLSNADTAIETALTQRMSPSQMHGLLAAGGAASGHRLTHWSPPAVEDLQKLLPQYEVSAFIARGGMGAVYKGQQKTLKRPVAIKVLPPDLEEGDLQFAARFKHEAQAMAQLSHPNIVAVFDAGETPDGLLYFVMEFIEGTDVAQLIASEGQFDPLRAIQITTAVCEALAFAHEEGIIHRDIKPSNIMLDKRGRVKVADFGLAKTVNLEHSLQTQSNMAMGTPDFIAPEALMPGMKVDERADLYAVGVMLYQMLTGHIPRGRFELPSGLMPQMNKGFDAVVHKAMQTDREKRYSTATEMKTAVERVRSPPYHPAHLPASGETEPESAQATSPSPSPRQGEESKGATLSQPLLLGAAAAMVLGLSVLFMLPGKPKSESSPPPAKLDALSEAEALKLVVATTHDITAWQDILREPAKLTLTGAVARVPDGLRFTDAGAASLSQGPRRNGGIRMRATFASTHLGLRARKGDGAYELSPTNGKEIVLRRATVSSIQTKLGVFPLPEPLRDGQDYELELRIIGDRLTAFYNGTLLCAVTDGTYAKGAWEVASSQHGSAPALVKSLQAFNLDGLPEAEALKLAGKSSSPSPQPPSPRSPPASTPADSSIPWHDWLAENEAARTMPPQLTKEAGSWRITLTNSGSGAYARFNAPLRGTYLKDAAIRVTYVPALSDPDRQVHLGVRIDSDVQGWRMSYNIGEKHWVLDMLKNRTSSDLLTIAPMPEVLASREPRTVELRMVGDTLSFYYNGTLGGSTYNATPAAGYVSFSGVPGMLIHKVEWADLSVLPVDAEKTPRPNQRSKGEP